jgi:hypothetical protein
MYEISTHVNGKPIRVDLHKVRLTGTNVLATKLAQPDLFLALKKLGLPVAAHMGWQELCLQLAASQEHEATQ